MLRIHLLIVGLALVLGAAPARADFETAKSAYDQGSYKEAYEQFSTLARDGDERAQPYLERIYRILHADTTTSGATGSSAPSGGGASGGPSARPGFDWSIDIPRWNTVGGDSAAPTLDDIVVPYHESVWSSLIHLPADATVIGLQYVARLLDADRLYRDLQMIGRSGDKITLGVLAGFWWLLILRGVYGLVVILARLIRTVFTSWEHETNG